MKKRFLKIKIPKDQEQLQHLGRIMGRRPTTKALDFGQFGVDVGMDGWTRGLEEQPKRDLEISGNVDMTVSTLQVGGERMGIHKWSWLIYPQKKSSAPLTNLQENKFQ